MKKKVFAVFMIVAMLLCFMPSMAFAGGSAEADNGAVLKKTAVQNNDGSVEITLKAYTGSKTVTSVRSKPVDIVLVLDQSGSMKFDFSGNSTKDDENRRQFAMKNAVTNFIDKIDPDGGHRVSIVKFGSNADQLAGWTDADEAGKTQLKNAVNSLPMLPDGATNVAAGMQTAASLLTSANADSQKVVIVFTDGVPTTSDEFSTGVADNAIAVSKGMKEVGVKVYTIGIFNGADPSQMYGAVGFDTNSDGTVGSEWKEEELGLFPNTDFPKTDLPAGNRFLNLLSSNFKDASKIGLTRTKLGLGILRSGIKYKITENFDPSDSKYYLTASDASGLSNVFEQIQSETMVPAIDLDENTEIIDTISDYYNVPTEIKLYTADYDGSKDIFDEENKVAAPESVTASVSGKTVTVKGFDFNENFISKTARPVNGKDFYGKELIIKITVTPNYNAIESAVNAASGKVEVPTNADAKIVQGGETVAEAPSPKISYPVYTYELNYNANGGTAGSVEQQTKTTTAEGHTFTIPDEAEPTKAGYTFKGWADTSDATTAAYSVGGSVALTVNNPSKTLYAVWEEKQPEPPQEYTYELNYDAAGGTPGSVAQQTKTTTAEGYTFTIPAEAEPTKAGYNFLGWTDGSDAVSVDYHVGGSVALTVNNPSKTIYAVWEEKQPEPPLEYTYELNYDANGGTAGTVTQQRDTTTETEYTFIIPAEAQPTKAGYTFKGWADTSDATTAAYSVGGSVTLTVNNPSKTLYAVWEKVTIIIPTPTPEPEGPGEVIVPDPDVPLGPGEVEEPEEPEDPIVIVEEPEVPRDDAPETDVPKTGDNGFGTAGILFFLSAAGLAALAVTGRKKEEAEK